MSGRLARLLLAFHPNIKVPPPGCPQGAPKLKVAIVGSGLAGLSTAVELLDQVGAAQRGVGQ